jgi:hypothetical protein
MVNDNNQEVDLYATSYKNNKENKAKNQVKNEKFFAFLVNSFFKHKEKKRNFCLSKYPP